MKHFKSVQILSNFRMSSPLHKRKEPLLKTFWRRFCTNTQQSAITHVQSEAERSIIIKWKNRLYV